MYGTPVPTSVAAGIPAATTPVVLGWDATQTLWLVLLVVTLVTLALAVARLMPKTQR